MVRPSTSAARGAAHGLRVNRRITPSMMPSITFSPTIGITAARIDRLGLDIRSFHEPLKRSIQRVIGPSFQRNIDEGGRPDTWESFADDTPQIQSDIKGWGEHPLLKATGTMYTTMGQLNIWTIGTQSAILDHVPDKIWYAKIHQAGYEGRGGGQKVGKSDSPAGRLRSIVDSARAHAGESDKAVSPIPARPFVLIQDEDVVAIEAIFYEWLLERINRAWPPSAGRLP